MFLMLLTIYVSSQKHSWRCDGIEKMKKNIEGNIWNPGETESRYQMKENAEVKSLLPTESERPKKKTKTGILKFYSIEENRRNQ